MSKKNYNPKRDEREREKLKGTIIVGVFCFGLIVLLAIIWIGVSSPYGLENYFKSLWQGFLAFLDKMRFKFDFLWRFADSFKK